MDHIICWTSYSSRMTSNSPSLLKAFGILLISFVGIKTPVLPAVKTGAISLDEDGSDEVETIDTSHIDLVVRNSDSKRQTVEGKIEDDGASQIVTSAEESSIGVVSTDESDEDLLDLLVDTLDCEFDPNLLV